MQSRRHQEYAKLSPPARRAPGTIEMGVDRGRHVIRHQEAAGKSPSNLRNSSSHTRRGSPERIEQYWNSRSMRGERHLPGSISHGEIRKRPHNDVDKSTGDTEFCLPSGISDADGGSRLKHVHGYDHATYGIMDKERELNTGRATPFKGKSTAIEEGEIPEPYCEICAKEQSPSHEIDMSQRIDDRFRPHDHMIRSSLTESYKEREGVIYTGQGSLSAHHTADGLEFSGYFHNNGSRRPPGSNLKRKIPDSYGDDGIFPSPGDHTYGIRSLELVNSSAYPNGLPVAAGRNYGKAQNQLLHLSQFQPSGYHINGNDHEELRYIKQQKITDENHVPHGHSCKTLHEMKSPRAQLHYNCSQIKDHIGEESAQCCRHSASDGIAVIDDYGNASHSTAWKQTSLGKRTVPRCCEEANAPQQRGKLLEFMYTHPDYENRTLQNRTAVNFGSRGDYISWPRLDHGFQTDADSKSSQRNYHSEEMSIYGRKAHGIAARLQRVEEDDGMYIPKKHLDYTVYGVEEDFLGDNCNHMMTRKWNTFECADLEDRDGLVDEQNVNDIYGSGSHSDENRIVEMACHRQISQRGFAPNERVSIKNRLEYLPEHPVRYGKYRGKGMNMLPQSGHMKSYQSNHHIGKTTGFYKNQKLGKMNEGYFEDNLAHEYDPSVDEEIPEEPELPEDSDEFKQLTNEAFLKYSKTINSNSAVQRRYRAQGKAGSLFCIVCSRRSISNVLFIFKIEHLMSEWELNNLAEHSCQIVLHTSLMLRLFVVYLYLSILLKINLFYLVACHVILNSLASHMIYSWCSLYLVNEDIHHGNYLRYLEWMW